jgi:hypothetical protein
MYFFMYSLFFFILSSTCFVCYLHPSSGERLQRTAIGVCMVLVCYFIGAGTGWDTLTVLARSFSDSELDRAKSSLSTTRPEYPQWYRTGVLSASISFLDIERSHRVPNQGSTVGGWGMTATSSFARNYWVRTEV